MSKKLSFATYIKDELAVVYPQLPIPKNATRSQQIWIFMKQDLIAYFAPIRLVSRGIKSMIKSVV